MVSLALAILLSACEATIVPPDSSCIVGTHGPLGCSAVFVPTEAFQCLAVANSTCAAVEADHLASIVSNGCSAQVLASNSSGSKFMWGMVVSIIGDAFISVGLAFQKVAHNRIKLIPQGDGTSTADRPATTEQNEGASEPSVYGVPVWWFGIILTVGGEIGNFAAYGDPNTPAAVVTSVGCVGVIANSMIATLFLREPCRLRDLLGCAMVVAGVVMMVLFAPQQQCALTATRFYWLLAQPGAVALLVLLGMLIMTLSFLCPKYGHRHVLWNLSQASLIGSLTVMASKAVSTFLGLTLTAIVSSSIPVFDQVDLGKDEQSCGEAGYHWGSLNATPPVSYGCITVDPWYHALNDTSGNVILHGAEELTDPAMLVCLVVLAVSGVAQVKYINRGMADFGNSQVIPVHYVTFTLFSIIATSLFYQEFVVDEPFYLHLFLDGCALTFLGVYLITTTRQVRRY